MIRCASTLLLCGAVFGAAIPSSAQQVAETILPDRPGLGDGAHVLGPGVLQVEVGLETAFGTGPNVLSFGQSLVRYGVGGIELRLLPGSILMMDADLGVSDPAVGLKVPLVSGDGPRVSTVLAASIPVGSRAYSSAETSGAATLVGEFTLTGTLGLALNAGYSFPFEHADDGSVGVIITPGMSVTGVEGLALYGGYAGSFGPGRDTHIVEAGLAYASDADTQLDLNWGIDTDSRRWFLGAGVAHRWR